MSHDDDEPLISDAETLNGIISLLDTDFSENLSQSLIADGRDIRRTQFELVFRFSFDSLSNR